jgi:hypothetical protein
VSRTGSMMAVGRMSGGGPPARPGARLGVAGRGGVMGVVGRASRAGGGTG